MSRARLSKEDKQLAKEIYVNAKRRGPAPPTAEDEQALKIGHDGRGLARLVRRSRLGFIGSEPYEARRPVARTYVATYGALAGLFVTLAGQVHAGVAIVAACLLVGAPKTWTWTHDRLGAGLWVLAAALLVAGEVTWASGPTARATLAHHGNPGSALALVFIGGLVALVGFFRRWGTGGNVFYAAGQHDAEADAVAAEAARREGAGRNRPAPATDADTIQALQDAERRDPGA